jgi:hypothetical protein
MSVVPCTVPYATISRASVPQLSGLPWCGGTLATKAAALLADVGFTTQLPQNGGEGEPQTQKVKGPAECTEQATDAPAT